MVRADLHSWPVLSPFTSWCIYQNCTVWRHEQIRVYCFGPLPFSTFSRAVFILLGAVSPSWFLLCVGLVEPALTGQAVKLVKDRKCSLQSCGTSADVAFPSQARAEHRGSAAVSVTVGRHRVVQTLLLVKVSFILM